MNSQTQDDTPPKATLHVAVRVVLFIAVVCFGPGALVYIGSRAFDIRIPLALALAPGFFLPAYFASVVLFVWLGNWRRKRGWSLPFCERWHIGATSNSDETLCHLAISAAICLFLGAAARDLMPAAGAVVVFCMVFLLPIRDRMGRRGSVPVLIAVSGFTLMLLPIRLIRLYGLGPRNIAAAVALFAFACVCLGLTLAWKSEDAWMRAQRSEPGADADLSRG